MNSNYPEPYECLAAQILQQEKEVTMQGWMKKKSGRKKLAYSPTALYDNRYFILLKGWVYYYKHPTSQNPQGCFSLEGYSNRIVGAEEEKSTSLPYVFKLYPQSKVGRTWFFAPDSKPGMDKWIGAFKKEIEQYNKYRMNTLRGSQSLPDKFRPNHLNNHNGPRTRSANTKQTSRIRDNLLESSCNTSSGGSIISSTSDNYEDPDSNNGEYESFDNSQDHADESYVDFDDINHPSELPFSNNNPAGWRSRSETQIAVTQHRKNSPLPAIPNSSMTPPLPARDFPGGSAAPVYDTIDENEVNHEQRFIFPNNFEPPVPQPQRKPNLHPCSTEKISRDGSFPLHRPPKPPIKLSPKGHQEELNAALRRNQESYFHDKPLPPLPQEDNFNEAQSNYEEFDSSGRSSPEMYSNVFEDETSHVELREEDTEQTYDDNVVVDEDSRSQFHQTPTLTGGKFPGKQNRMLPNQPRNKPATLFPKVPEKPVNGQKHLASNKPATPAKPHTPMKPPTQTPTPSKPSTPSKPPPPARPVKPVTSSKPPPPSTSMKPSTSSKPPPPVKPSASKPPPLLKPKQQTSSSSTPNQLSNPSSHGVRSNFSLTSNKFGNAETASSNFDVTDKAPNSRTFGFKLPDQSYLKAKTLPHETRHETFSSSAEVPALSLKNAPASGNSRTTPESALSRTTTAPQDPQSCGSESVDPSLATFLAKAKLFGERTAKASPLNNSTSVLAKAKSFSANPVVPPVSNKPQVAKKPYLR